MGQNQGGKPVSFYAEGEEKKGGKKPEIERHGYFFTAYSSVGESKNSIFVSLIVENSRKKEKL